MSAPERDSFAGAVDRDGNARLGFVVIGRNEGDRLAACLRSIGRYGLPVVYADSRSTDGSPQVARRLGADVLVLDGNAPLNASRGRAEGLRRLCVGHPGLRYVQFVDGDCLLQDGWVEGAAVFLDGHPRVAAVCGRRMEAHPEASFYNRLFDDEWNTSAGEAEACGGDAMMRIEAVEQVGSFNPRLMASEEPELCARLRAQGWKIWRLDLPMTIHDAGVMHFGQLWRRSMRAGYGNFQAWRATRHLPTTVNRHYFVSAGFWMLAVPLGGLLLAVLVHPALILAWPVAWGAQVARMAAREGPGRLYSWRKAAVYMAVKGAELIGAGRALSSRLESAFDYKRSGQAG